MPPFTVYIRVRYAECDAQQVVFNARYADYIDITTNEYLRALFVNGYHTILEEGLDTQMVKMLTQWQAPAHYDEVIAVTLTPGAIGNTSFTLNFNIEHSTDRSIIATVETVYVLVDNTHYKKTPIPDWMREKLAEGAPGKSMDFAGVSDF